MMLNEKQKYIIECIKNRKDMIYNDVFEEIIVLHNNIDKLDIDSSIKYYIDKIYYMYLDNESLNNTKYYREKIKFIGTE